MKSKRRLLDKHKEKKMEETKAPVKKQYLEGIKVGDKVWEYLSGWGEVLQVYTGDCDYPIKVSFGDGCYDDYDFNGRNYREKNPTLFWDEVKMTPPPRPKRKVKKKFWVNVYQKVDGCDHEYSLGSETLYNSEDEAVRKQGTWSLRVIAVAVAFEVEE